MAEYGFDNNPFLFHKDDYDCRGFLDDYEILEKINGGSFGIVYKARDKKTDEMVAIKEEFHGLTSSTLMEINILRSLPRHPNIVEFKGAGDAFVVMELLNSDLKRTKDKNGGPFSLMEIKYLIREILKGVKFLHENGVMHRDLKPANILLSEDSNVKICDFGLSAPIGTASHGVGTRFYKAPEILDGGYCYTGAVDVWSVGCIMAELALNKPLFQGTSEKHQLVCIQQLLCDRENLVRLRMSTDAAFSGATALGNTGLHLLERLLAYLPIHRISARDALNHPWFTEDPLPPMW